MVKKFHEKPNQETAQEYIKQGYLWNSGMVIGQVKVIWSLLERYQPALVATLKTLNPDFSNLKEIYQKLPNISFDYAVLEHLQALDFKIINEESGFKAKVIRVLPGYQLSYQSHNHRSEHWVIAQGEAIVTIADQDHRLKRGDYIFIKAQQKHRLKNPGLVDLKVIEVQIGEYLGEDDITRYQDHYGRLN